MGNVVYPQLKQRKWGEDRMALVLGHALLALPCGGSVVNVSLSISTVSPRQPVPVRTTLRASHRAGREG